MFAHTKSRNMSLWLLHFSYGSVQTRAHIKFGSVTDLQAKKKLELKCKTTYGFILKSVRSQYKFAIHIRLIAFLLKCCYK